MDKLSLCQRLRQESGIAGTGPTSALSSDNTGELKRVIEWIETSYEEIQDKNEDWDFLRNSFSFNCTIAQATYPTTTVSNLANWKKDSLRVYLTTINDEQWLRYWTWDDFRDVRLKGANNTVTGRPIDFSIKPDKSLILWPIPDNTYTIVGEYYRTAHVMDASGAGASPLFSRDHMVIVYNGLMKYAAYAKDPSLFAFAQLQYGKLIDKLEKDRSPNITAGGTLA